MNTPAPSGPDERVTAGLPSGRPAGQVTERQAWSTGGIKLLWVGLAVYAAGGELVSYAGTAAGAASRAALWLGLTAFVVGAVVHGGLIAVVPGEARAIQLFGNYRGTVREPGMQWVNPFTRKIRVSTRLRNHETAVAKVNDADGNPIEIAAVVVWHVRDTARAIYSVDDYAKFVGIQTEAAVRHIASSYPYDSRGSGRVSLRDNADEINQELSVEIAARVRPAGVKIIESRLSRLSYATEIAQTMLRQQQASAVVGARQRIVEGAVGMVREALQRLEDEGVIELDEERRAAMVSNLLVVLCSEQATQQVVNTGTLYS
jgi:regulator of protease activity HflC (stomatin/prohibitin superfamily)